MPFFFHHLSVSDLPANLPPGPPRSYLDPRPAPGDQTALLVPDIMSPKGPFDLLWLILLILLWLTIVAQSAWAEPSDPYRLRARGSDRPVRAGEMPRENTTRARTTGLTQPARRAAQTRRARAIKERMG